MKPIAVLRNDPGVPPGYLGDALDRSGMPWQLIRLDEGDPLPEVDARGVAVLGGLMGAYDTHPFPYLVAEKRFVAKCVEADIPVLGICLGAQLLADALGGKAFLADRPEAAFAPVELTKAGAADPVMTTLSGRSVLRLHQDTFEMPPGATRLASGGGFEQAFRMGSALAVQPHPEATPEIVNGWLVNEADRRLVRKAGADPADIVGSMTDPQRGAAETASGFFEAWLSQC